MADTVREKILVNLQATVEGITVDAGFNYTIASVHRGNYVPALLNGPWPSAAIFEPDEDYPDEASRGSGNVQTVKMHVSVIVQFQAPGDAKSPRVSKIIHDLHRAILLDGTRGGLAIETDPVGVSSGVHDEAGSFGSVMARYRVHYRFARADLTVAR